jgi:hypothetical protein
VTPIEGLIDEVIAETGRHGERETLARQLPTIIRSLHYRAYFKPDLRSGVVNFGKPYRIAQVPLTLQNFGLYRRIKQIRHCSPTTSGLPLGHEIVNRDMDMAVTEEAMRPVDHYVIMNNAINLRLLVPVSQVWVQYFALSGRNDWENDWIFQRYYELVKWSCIKFIAGSSGDTAKVNVAQAEIVPLLLAFIADNEDRNAEQ